MVTSLAPTLHNEVGWSLVEPLNDVDAIGNMKLQENVKSAQKKELKYIPICVSILELAFFHRFSMRGVWSSKESSLVQHWTYDLLN